MEEIKRFEKTDWYGYAGAEQFIGGKEPFIYRRKMNEGLVELTVIADKNGLSVELIGEKSTACWMKMQELGEIRAEGEIRALVKGMENYTYAPDLAYELDHPSKEVFKGFDFCDEYEN